MRNTCLRIILFIAISSHSVFAQNAWTIYKTSNSAILDNTIKAIAIGNDQHKWVGASYGLGEYNDTTWTMYTTSNSGLPDDNILSLNVDKNNVVWIGTNNGGLARFDGTTWAVWNTSNSLLPSDEIKCITFDTAGVKWIGTANGLVKFDDTTFTVWNHTNTSMFLVDIHAIAIDKNNVKYISSLNSGLFYLEDTMFTNYLVTNSYLQDNSVFAIAIDSSQNRWYGTAGKGLMSQHTDSVTWEWYYPINTPADSVWTVNCILIDSLQNKYTGSDLTGLVKYDGTTWTYWETYNSPLPNNKVNTIAQEKNGVLWIGTDNGLARFDEKISTSIESVDETPNVQVYPNPASDQIQVFMDETSDQSSLIEIVDILGAVHLRHSLHHGQQSIPLPEADFTSGVYFYHILQEGKRTSNNKLMIVR